MRIPFAATLIAAIVVAIAPALACAADAPPPAQSKAEVERLLGGPLSRDVETLVVQAAELRIAGEEDKSHALLAIAERVVLHDIVDMPLGELPRRLGEAIAQEQASSPVARDWQKAALERSVTYFATPTRADASIHSFRNEAGTPLRALTAMLAVDGKPLAVCERDAAKPPVGAGALAEVKCNAEVSKPLPADLHTHIRRGAAASFRVTRLAYVAGDYTIGTHGAFFGDREEQARKRLAEAAAAASAKVSTDPSTVSAATASKPLTQKQRQNWRAAIIVTLAALLGGFLLGLPIGAFASKPVATSTFVMGMLTVIGAIVVLKYVHDNGGVTDNWFYTAVAWVLLWQQTVLLAMAVGWAWGCAVAGMAGGVAAGRRLARRQADVVG